MYWNPDKGFLIRESDIKHFERANSRWNCLYDSSKSHELTPTHHKSWTLVHAHYVVCLKLWWSHRTYHLPLKIVNLNIYQSNHHYPQQNLMSNSSVVATNSHPKTRFQAKIADAIFRQDQFHQRVAMDQYLPVESRVQTWHFQDRSYDPMYWVGPFLPRNLNFWWIYQLKRDSWLVVCLEFQKHLIRFFTSF